MEKTRLESLLDAVSENPENAFLRYGLALELANAARPAEAWEHFDYLLSRHPDYAATYYQAGIFLVKQGRREEAAKIFSRGIEIAGRQKNAHAQSELQAALDDLSE